MPGKSNSPASDRVRHPTHLRDRFVRTAEFWARHQRHPTFRNEIADARVRWNDDFPLFPIRQGPAPERVRPWSPDEPPLYPRGLQLALDASNRRLGEGGDRLRSEDLDRGAAVEAWAVLLHRLCDQFWPPDLFPNWTGTRFPPPVGFVAACLLDDPERVDPKEWIPQISVRPQPRSLLGDLSPMTDYWHQRHLRLVNLLCADLDAGAEITRGRLAEAIREAEAGATRVVAPSLIFPALGDPVGHLPLFPGMSTKDFRDAEGAVKPLLDRGDELLSSVLKAHARAMRGTGRMTVAEIAGRLGVRRDAVYKYLGET